jgi:hypothetical protein
VPADHSPLLDEISSLLALPPGHPGLAAVDDTLTAGYAQAMALEAERWRLERRIGEVAGEVAAGTGVDELVHLARRMSAADGEISRLRTLLQSLHDRARELRFVAEASLQI